MQISEETKSVIIGLYRQGNSSWIIAHLSGVTELEVERIIENYLSKKKTMSSLIPFSLN